MAKLVRTNLTDQVFDYIQEQISSGNWKRGEKIPSENELSEMLGVSRMTLRTAIQKTNVMGITETKVGEGTFVKKYSMRPYLEELMRSNLIDTTQQEINQMRDILQIGSFRLARNMDDFEQQIELLENLYAEMKKAAENSDIDAFHAADTKFHSSVCKACHNEMLFTIYDALAYLLDEASYQNVVNSIEYNDSYDVILEYHRELINFMKNKDLEGFSEHLRKTAERDKVYHQALDNKRIKTDK